MALREDVGRHNALDKLAGALACAGISAARGIVPAAGVVPETPVVTSQAKIRGQKRFDYLAERGASSDWAAVKAYVINSNNTKPNT